MMTKSEATAALIETARFSAGIFREIERTKLLGQGSLAGKAIEAGSHLLAAADLAATAPAHRYTFDRLDSDNFRVYYRREDRRLFCIHLYGHDRAGEKQFRFMPCSQDGEPSHCIEMPVAEAFDRLVFPS